jgi:Alpha-2,8-polysialyltransferase (POLYST)
MVAQLNQNVDEARDVFLCGTRRHLLMALATIAQAGRSATLIYLEDALPISAEMRTRLKQACPQVTFIFTKDSDQIAAFARLPRMVPAIVRRNLTFGGMWGVMRPDAWQCPLIKDQRFGTGYVYHSVFFMAKVLAGRCDQMVLREDGLSNYVGREVPPFKAALRLLCGLSPRHQIWGEERWIARIEVSRPDDLPTAVRAKAVRLSFRDVMEGLPVPTARRIAAAFLPEVPQLAQGTRTAILLTQPLDAVGICSSAQMQQIYTEIADRLMRAGYRVYVKPHPTEGDAPLPGVMALPPDFPVEVWPYVTDQKFSLAVALCSASLAGGARAFAHRTTQLLGPGLFNAGSFADWPALISAAIAAALKDDTGV